MFQLTRGAKSSGAFRWSPDGRWLAFTSARAGDKNQVFAIRPDGGEAVQLTKSEGGVNDFAWSADGRFIAFTAPEGESQARKDRKDYYSEFDVVRRDYAYAQLWTVAFDAALEAPQTGTQRTRGTGFSVGQLAWAPDGTRIAFSATLNPDLVQGATADLYVLALGDDSVKQVVSQAGPDTNPRWSPDGTQVAFVSAMGRPEHYHANSRIAVVPSAGGTPRSLTDTFDESPNLVAWSADGAIYFSALQKTAGHLFKLDPVTGRLVRVSAPDDLAGGSFSVTSDGRDVAYVATSPRSMAEVFAASRDAFPGRQLTSMTDQLKGWSIGTREVPAADDSHREVASPAPSRSGMSATT